LHLGSIRAAAIALAFKISYNHRLQAHRLIGPDFLPADFVVFDRRFRWRNRFESDSG